MAVLEGVGYFRKIAFTRFSHSNHPKIDVFGNLNHPKSSSTTFSNHRTKIHPKMAALKPPGGCWLLPQMVYYCQNDPQSSWFRYISSGNFVLPISGQRDKNSVEKWPIYSSCEGVGYFRKMSKTGKYHFAGVANTSKPPFWFKCCVCSCQTPWRMI